MPFMEWDDQFEMGISEIDLHHQKLMKLLNALYDGVMICPNLEEEKKLTGAVVDELLDYTRYHFLVEEKLMADYGYPDLQLHKREHDWFVAQVSDLRCQLDAGTLVVSVAVFALLKDWLTRHILVNDHKYRPFVIQLD